MENYILQEASRKQLITKSKQADNYAPSNQSKGKNRYERRVHSKVSKSVAEFNKLDMNSLFKFDILNVVIKVHGETDDYEVRICFPNVIEYLSDFLKDKDDSAIDLRWVMKALTKAFDGDDVYIHCTCPDWKYRHDYWATKNKISSGDPQTDPGKGIVNPKDTKGAGCKHTLLVLANNTWLIKVASVIRNYILYMKAHQEKLYAEIIYPALFGKPYEEPYQLDIDDSNVLNSDEGEIDTSNKWSKTKTQFKAGNEYRFKPNENKDDEIPKQFSLDDLISDSE